MTTPKVSQPTKAQKQEALDLLEEWGVAEVHRRTGISPRTLAKWQAELRQDDADWDPNKARQANLGWMRELDRKTRELAEGLLDGAIKLQRQMWEPTKVHKFDAAGDFHEATIDEPTFKDKRDITVAIAISVDKLGILVERIDRSLGRLGLVPSEPVPSEPEQGGPPKTLAELIGEDEDTARQVARVLHMNDRRETA